MPVWRCPHCATPQAEASRCWVCRRSTTSCVTCRHYRRAITGDRGLCGLDPVHPVVEATDVQPCWVAAPSFAAGIEVGPGPLDWLVDEDRPRAVAGRPHRTFVPVDDTTAAAPEPIAVAVLGPGAVPAPSPAAEPVAVAADAAVPGPVEAGAPSRIPGRFWLWGDPEPWPER